MHIHDKEIEKKKLEKKKDLKISAQYLDENKSDV